MTTVNPDLGKALVIEANEPPKEMLSVITLPNGKKKVRINASSLSIIQECMRKAKYSLDEGWKETDSSPGIIFGSAFHKALEVFYAGPLAERYVPDMELMESMSYGNKVPREEEDFILHAIRSFVDKAQPLSPLPATDKRSIQNGMWILRNYFKVFKDDPYVALVDEQGPFIEREFSLVIHEDESLLIEIFGTIDFAFRHTGTGDIIIGDHKTSAFLSFGGSSYFDREKPNLQYSCYALGAREVFGLNTNNFMVNIIEVKAKPKTARGSIPSFPRQITTRTEDDFDEFRETVLYYVRSYLAAKESGVWPLGPVGSCNAYGKCTFKEICAAPKQMRSTILTSKFKKEGANALA